MLWAPPHVCVGLTGLSLLGQVERLYAELERWKEKNRGASSVGAGMMSMKMDKIKALPSA